MEKRQIQSKRRYILAFIIGTLIFITGFFITTIISYYQFNRISEFQDEVSYNIFKDKFSYSFFEEDICSLESFKKISEDLGFQGAIITDLENKLGKNNKKVLFRKKFYTLIELEHFEFINQLNEKCASNISTILFFYSNKEESLKESENAGKLLSYLHQKYKETLIIYSFDAYLNSPLIEKLVKKYSIESSPTIIINNRKKIKGEFSIEDIEKELNKTDQSVIWL